MPIIKKFQDGSVLEYDRGLFDKWCVYLTRPDVARHAPLDVNYFTRLQQLGTTYTPNKIYDDFIIIYNKTTKEISKELLDDISNLSKKYNDNDCLEMDILFTILYMGMIAEENKENTRLGKKIKRLGIHQVLIEGMNPEDAANFSRGKGWREIHNLCYMRGF